MTPNDVKLNQAFRAVAASGPQEAPARVEVALRGAFRKETRRGQQTRWVWSGLAAVAAAAMAIVVLIPKEKKSAPPEVRLAHIDVPRVPIARANRPAAAKRRSAKPAERTEVVTRFYPLPEADTLVPLEYGAVVRVQLPRSALRVVGLPVNEDRLSERIQADVLLGQDGLARAVRFIQ